MPDVFVSPTTSTTTTVTTTTTSPVVPGPNTAPNLRHHHRRLSSFSLYPDDVNFETKDEKEQIILFLRQHPIINVKWIFVTLVLLTGPTLLNLIGIFSYLPAGFPLIITLAWYLVTSTYAIEGFLGWYFNVFMVTNERIIDVDFYNLIDKTVSDAEINKIQDVTYSTNGVLQTTLNFGDVFVQTAAEVSEFRFESVPNPGRVAKILGDLIEKNNGKHSP